jgi:hypothetical protein
VSCAAFDVIAVRIARGEELGPGLREDALAHAKGCARCAGRLEDERALTSALAVLADQTAVEEAPARVEWALRRTLRETETGEAPTRRRAWPVRAVAATIVAAAVVAVIALLPRGTPPTEPGRPAALGAPAATAAAESFSPEFMPLSYGEDLGEMDSLQVVQVKLPRTALAAFGWPAGETPMGVVTAEVIVGHDGVARAIRLLE